MTGLEEFKELSQLDRLAYKGQEGLTAMKQPILELLQHLRGLAGHATEEEKVNGFRECIFRLNALNRERDGDLLSTDEREAILPLLDRIAERVGLQPYEAGYHGEWLDEWLEF